MRLRAALGQDGSVADARMNGHSKKVRVLCGQVLDDFDLRELGRDIS